MGAGLVGDYVDDYATAHDFGEHVGAVAYQAHGQRPAFAAGGFAKAQCFVEVLGDGIGIARGDAAFDAATVDVDSQNDAVVKRYGEWLSATHAAHAAGDDKLSLERAAEVPVGEGGKGLEGSLENTLGADVDPTAGGHLAVHHQALAVELVEVFPGGPFADKVGIGDDDTRRHLVGGKDSDRFA